MWYNEVENAATHNLIQVFRATLNNTMKDLICNCDVVSYYCHSLSI